jgi:hypothetical protein
MTDTSTARLAYDDLSTPAEMHDDCRAVRASLTRPLAAAAIELSREQRKPGIEISAATARIAGALHLQVDGD